MSDLVATEDVLSREEQKKEPLYAGRVKVYPKSIRGNVRRIKWIALILFLGLYYLAPWLRWDRGPGVPDPLRAVTERRRAVVLEQPVDLAVRVEAVVAR